MEVNSQPQFTNTVGNRYLLHEQIGIGGMGEVFRAYDRLNQQIVALKRVLLAPDELLFDAHDQTDDQWSALSREFSVLASLRHPNVVSVLDYGFDDLQRPFFTMEYLENAGDFMEGGRFLSEDKKLDLVLEILQGLQYLHRRGLLHRDLKPSNIMLVDGHAKLIDFGLAIEIENANTPVGTITYLAPEIFESQNASVASDLYAVGLIAYTLFVGKYPFDTRKSITGLIEDIISVPADCANLPAKLRPIIERLLSKQPSQRYPTAYDCILAFASAIEGPIVQETIPIRESFLQAARFVGRSQQLHKLIDALTRGLKGHGSSWLIGGESGVGKSRLVEEFRAKALVKGALVLQGSSIEGGGLPYQMLREPLRRLVLATPISDMEAGILKDLVPDIDRLIGHSVPTVPELTRLAHQQRLVFTMVDIFKRISEPIVLLLEDLQWANAGLEILKQLTLIADKVPLMIIATYRDHDRPNLPTEFPESHVMILERLTSQSVAELSISMMGEAGRQPEVIEFLEKETEGNVFFIVETIRALAEEAGSLTNVGQMTLPEQVFSGGVRRILQHRLAHVPHWAYEGLQVAAVSGRVLDLDLLNHILPLKYEGFDETYTDSGFLSDSDTYLALEGWLLLCSESAILDVFDGQWRFVHDKLRQQILMDAETNHLANLHVQVAETLTQIHGDDIAYAGVLADHWKGGRVAIQEQKYAFLAGKEAIRRGEIQEAIDRLKRSYTLSLHTHSENRSAILVALGDVSRLDGHYDEAIAYFEQAITSASTDQEIAVALIGLAWAQQTRGEDQGSLESAEKAELLLRESHGSDNDVAEALYHKGWAYYRLGQMKNAQEAALEGLELSKAMGAQEQMAHHLNLLGVLACYVFGRYAEALDYQERALAIHRRLGDRHGESILLNNLAETERLQGNYSESEGLYSQALAIAYSTGDRDGAMAYQSNLCGTWVGLRKFAEASRTLEKLIANAPQDWYVLPDALNFLGKAYLGQDKFDKAFITIQQVFGISNVADESIATAWQLMAKIAEHKPNHSIYLNGDTMTVRDCYRRSKALFLKLSMQRDYAIVLWCWAHYEFEHEGTDLAVSMWNEALDLFRKLELPAFALQMEIEGANLG